MDRNQGPHDVATRLNLAKCPDYTFPSATKYLYICIEYHSVCPLVEIEALPPPLSPASEPLPPEPKGGGGHARLRVRSWGSSNSAIPTTGEKASTLPTLCTLPTQVRPVSRCRAFTGGSMPPCALRTSPPVQNWPKFGRRIVRPRSTFYLALFDLCSRILG